MLHFYKADLVDAESIAKLMSLTLPIGVKQAAKVGRLKLIFWMGYALPLLKLPR